MLGETAKLYYEGAMRIADEKLEKVGSYTEEGDEENAFTVFKEMERIIKEPWMNQANKRRRHSPPPPPHPTGSKHS